MQLGRLPQRGAGDLLVAARFRHALEFASGARLSGRTECDVADEISATEVDRPIFISGLARSGSTILLELLVLRTGLFRDPRYWIALAIVAAFQLLVNGVLTCPPIVSYDPVEILGPRIACAPVEDLGFGFAMVTTTIALWRHAAPDPDSP